MEFILPYYVSNNGDGSASVCFMKTCNLANNHPDAEKEWGESTAGFVKLKIDKGKLFYEEYSFKSNRYMWRRVNERCT